MMNKINRHKMTFNFIKKATVYTVAFFLFAAVNFAQQTLSPNTNYLTDFGKMWTFDDLPLDYFNDQYGFEPSEEWIEKVQKSALQFGGGCSGAFLSEDGLIMTNHHCARGGLLSVQKDDEDLFKTGFYAETLADERKIDGLYVDQLVKIIDVTDEIFSVMQQADNDSSRIEVKNQKIKEIQTKYNEETGLESKVVTLYNGGKYSLYLYRRYDDIRVVMAPEFQIASTGWDWDNFTYPRYELDYMFLRAYENDQPAKIDFYFNYNPEGASEDEPIFIIGRPGNTDRQLSVAELEWQRDIRYPFLLQYLNSIYDAYYEMFMKYPERESELLNRVMGFGNSRKSYYGSYIGLLDETLMSRKKLFETELINKVQNDPVLKNEYGGLWSDIENLFLEKRKNGYREFVFNLMPFGRPQYLSMAIEMEKLINELRFPNEDRADKFRQENLRTTLESIYPENFDEELQRKLLRAFVSSIYHEFRNEHEFAQRLFNNNRGEEAVDYVLSNSFLQSRDKFLELEIMSYEEIKNANDPFIYFIQSTKDELEELKKRNKELDDALLLLNQKLGKVIVELFGEQMPPDATATLRLSDGVIKGYEYNGTIAPGKTTYYGMYDRYYSFGEKLYPWGLTPNWQTPPNGLDLKTPINFAATLDIVGGNSGSSIINQNAEVIGLVFDGNLESLAGNFLYMPENNRAVAVDSKGLIKSLKHVYKTDRLIQELLEGKLPN